ncbi:DAK2 domain-containing protein [Calidifontibacter sp. DB0510]|uniref:DAK2 domain-containing protein n=1 Tax=Metallococcus carri TaxID=1656884 RepID=A0A967AZ41_9MICO|nr:DAK2 domain-containing protein [Metallococcus carri]NHN54470.1 DAK2 domain-containing protein [Metallococcus carri]NOP36691.1 DAK2 domain-containing protein [Calidifontibacter sp. DB2511S]
MSLDHLDLHALRRWIVAARTDLAVHEEDLNGLNVFPVPDGDTGTNLLLTLDGALGSLTFTEPDDLRAAAEALAQATLMAARGNSGVILSQIARGVAEVFAEADGRPLGARDLAGALRRASDYAWRSVSRPVEGTILTVAASAADGAEQVAVDGDLAATADAIVRSARSALLRTTEQLPALERVGVVDAGGAGLLIVLEALQRVVAGDQMPRRSLADRPEWLPQRLPAAGAAGECGTAGEGGPAYEVMYLLTDSDTARVDALRTTLDGIGDSLVVAGSEPTWSVHVHVDDIAAAVNAGVEAGRPHRFRVVRFADELEQRAAATQDRRTVVVAVIDDAPGLKTYAKEHGLLVVSADAGRLARSSAIRSIREGGPEGVVLLADGQRSAETARVLRKSLVDKGVRAIVPDCSGPVELLAASSVVVPSDPPDRVDRAVNDALSDLRIGEVGGDASGEPLRLAAALLADLVTDETEIVTLVTGRGAPKALADTLRSDLVRRRADLEVVVVAGGGAAPLLAVGVE